MAGDNPIHLQIITPDSTIADVMTDYVDVPLVNGRYGILKNHAPVIGLMKSGKLRYDIDGTSTFVDVSEGVMHVKDNQVDILTGGAEDVHKDQNE